LYFESDSKLETIGPYSFFKCGFISVEVPTSVTRIERGAFMECGKMRVVSFSRESRLRFIGRHAFANTVLEKIKVPAGVPPKSIKFNEDGQFAMFEDGTCQGSVLHPIDVKFEVRRNLGVGGEISQEPAPDESGAEPELHFDSVARGLESLGRQDGAAVGEMSTADGDS
jgi:hypothetical protein